MDTLAAGFWGAFFGTAALMLAGSLAASRKSLRRVAPRAALAAFTSAFFTIAFLGWLPVSDPGAEHRLQAHVAALSAVSLGLMLMSMLGLLRPTERARRHAWLLPAAGALAIAAGWLVEPATSLILGAGLAIAVGLAMLLVTLGRARRGDRGAWMAVLGLLCMLAGLAGLSWIALHRGSGPVWLHAMSAVAAMAYLAIIAFNMWTRFSYLLELSEVMAHGPSYDPVTRMRSHSETSQMVGSVFFRPERGEVVGVIAVCIANLYALENLHGRAAFNHALFICASRLRRCVPADVEMGRLGEDGFLLLVRDVRDLQRLTRLARQIREHLVRPVSLGTSREVAHLDVADTAWVAEAGVGVMAAGPRVRPAMAVATARDMARTAWTYASRLAWYDQSAGEVAELPLAQQA
jgi:GGDEF domain-containing protein